MSDEGDDSPPRPKRKIKKVMVLSSASSSDSDDSGPTTSTRKKRLRVLSEDGSESSGSSVVYHRRRALPKLRDSDADSDTSGWATDHSDAPKSASKTSPKPSTTAKPASGFASDSSEGNSDKCSICLMRFTDQQVGTPQNCEHIFCLDCITEWSTNVNTCPVDRITFDSIVVRTCAGGRVLRTEPVKVVERPPSVEFLEVEDPTVCEVCGNSDSDETMLLCDYCDLGYHMECLTPPLTEIPHGQWLCPNCDDLLDIIHLSEVNDLYSEIGEVDLDSLGVRPSALRQPRTARRSPRAPRDEARPAADQPSTSTGRRGAAPRPTARAARRRVAATRRKNRRTRTKTVIIEYEIQENGKFPVTKTIKKRIKKRKIRKRQPRTAARRSHVRASVRAQLAALARAGGGVGGRAGAAQRPVSAAPALSLFGDPLALDYFEEDVAAPASGPALAARPGPAALSAYRQARRKMIMIPSPPHASAAPDLLSGILESQTLLHSRDSVATVAVDGSVAIKRRPVEEKRDGRVQPARARASGRQHGARGGGWGGGYRGDYHTQRAAHSATYRAAAPAPRAPPAPARAPPASRDAAPPLRPPPDPPVFDYDPELDKSEDGSDPDLVIDTEKYDPTEPTRDDESDEGAAPAPAPAPDAAPASAPAPAPASAPAPAPAAAPDVPAGVLDDAVRHVLAEHRQLLAPPSDDDDDDGDCPNFSIYSATSVHIASGSPVPPPPPRAAAPPSDLVQQDGAPSPPPSPSPPPAPAPPPRDEYKDRLSKRCPITTNPRNPIKIKLNTPSLIKRQVSLYDEEDVAMEAEPAAEPPAVPRNSNGPENGDAEPPEPAASPTRPSAPSPAPSPPPSSSSPPPVAASPAGSVPDEDPVEKMTESISETEDERSYTPCLDEQRDEPRDALRGLDTELISDEDELFTDDEPAPEEGELAPRERRRRRRERRERRAKPKKQDVAFKKIGKNKERNYRDKDKKRRDSGSGDRAERRRKRDKRKDLERYDVRSVVGDKRRRHKDAFGRDVSPARRAARAPSADPKRRGSISPKRRRSISPKRAGSISPKRRESISPKRRGSISPKHRGSISPKRRVSISPKRRGSISPKRRISLSPLRKMSMSPRRRISPSPRRRTSPSPRRRLSPSPRRPRMSPSPRRRASPSPRRQLSPSPRRRASASPRRHASASPAPAGVARRRRRRSGSRAKRVEARRRSRARKRRREPDGSPKPKSKKKKRAARAARRGSPAPDWARASPRTPPAPAPAPPRADHVKHRRRRDSAGPSKEVFTSGDNILVSVSFKEAGARRRRRRSGSAAATAAAAAGGKPVAIIDLERSPFRELTPSPARVIVLSDEEPAGPKTPPAAPAPEPASPDQYDPFEPTRSASASPAPAPPAPAPAPLTLEAAQQTSLSADELLDRRPLEPIEKVLALLQSTRDESPEPPPPAPTPPPKPKLFLAKPSPIKSDPIKPLVREAPGDSPYSPGSSDFGDLFEPPPARRDAFDALADDKPPPRKRAKNNKKKSKAQVDVKLDDDSLKIMEELPSSAVEMQVKSKVSNFLKKLNRQERVVEEVKLVLKPHYNKKRVSKDEYKHILRRAVPKICHNKSGEINPTKIQALVEAYVKKFRKKHKLGLA